jgi:hypothetical protein
VGSFKQAHSYLVCAGAVASLTDTVEFQVTPGDDGTFTVTNIKNSPTVVGPLDPPGGGWLTVSVVSPPDILLATGGKVDVSGDLVIVNLSGSLVMGSCKFTNKVASVTGPGQSNPGYATAEFYTNKFVDGTQTGVPTPYVFWTWIVTEL